MKRGSSVSKFLKPIDEITTQSYLTDELQVADVLEWVLDQFGVSEIRQTTFSISEEFLRRLHFIKEKGQISRLDMILDFKATNKTVNLWLFLEQVADNCYLADNHSKILLVKSRSGRKCAVITSQNLTRGNRNECAVITSEEHVYNILEDSFDSLIKSKTIPLNDILKTDS